MKTTTLFFALTTAIALSPAAEAQVADQVAPLRGTPATGRIVAMSKTELSVEVRGAARKFAVNEIRRVIFTEDPQELRRARDNCLAGRFDAALATLKQIDPASIQRKEVKQDLQFYLAYAEGRQALSGGGDKEAASQRMFEFVRHNQQSFHFFEAAELLGDLAVSMEKYHSAVAYYRAIANSAPWPDYKMKASILQAKALIAPGKFAEATEKLSAVTQQTVDTPQATRQKLLAEVITSVCAAETGDHETAIAALHKFIANNDDQDQELFGHAYNALGRCQLRAGRQQEALLAYLHVDILFYAEPDVHAEALYNLSKLWSAVGKTDRAVGARSLLMEQYAGSVWARKE